VTVPLRSASLTVLVAAAACGGVARQSQDGPRYAVRLGDTTRTYVLHAPPGAAAEPRPLLVAFHGTGESGREMERSAGLDAVADRRGFLVAYPDAAVGNWAEGCGCSRADLLAVNDTGFARAVVEDVARRHRVDRSRIYATGFSQGGLFVHRLACEMAETFAAVASVAAPMSAPLAERCRPSGPVGVLVLIGTLDQSYPYEGERSVARSTLGAREAADVWRVIDACGREAAGRELPDRAADGTRVLEERWTGCRGGVEVALYTVDGGRHAWSPSADVSTGELLVGFLLRQGQSGR